MILTCTCIAAVVIAVTLLCAVANVTRYTPQERCARILMARAQSLRAAAARSKRGRRAVEDRAAAKAYVEAANIIAGPPTISTCSSSSP